jgi:phosphonoacetate hydrolase
MVSGALPVVNGICGNYYYDPALGEEVMMNDPRFMKAPTLLAAMSMAGVRVAVVTVKDKLRQMLGHRLQGGICFSAEFAQQATLEENGIADVVAWMGKPNPGIYDPAISVYCLEAGARLLEEGAFDLAYLTTTDFVQHKYAPDAPEARAFMAAIDAQIGRLDALGAIIGLSADHGMNDKTLPDGSPRVQYAEQILRDAGIESRVILPINDPYVVHHGALGSFATVYLDELQAEAAQQLLAAVPGIEAVLAREEAAERFGLPADRIGNLVLLGDPHTVIGRTPEWHDLKDVQKGLRSHGGLHETRVPLIFNRPLLPAYYERLQSGTARNFDLFDFLLNGIA